MVRPNADSDYGDREVFYSFTLKLAKWDFVEAPVTVLGKQEGHGRVHPVAKAIAITGFLAPTIKRDLCLFLGMATIEAFAKTSQQ